MSQVGLFQPVARVCVEERQKETKGVGSSLCSLLEINGPDFANATRSVGSSRPSSTFLSTLVSSNFSPSLKLSHFSQFSYCHAMPSTSPLPLVPPSPPPWTPGARTLPVRLPRRRQAPQPSEEIPRGERSTNLRSSEGLHLGLPVILLLLLKTCVTNVNMWQLLKRG